MRALLDALCGPECEGRAAGTPGGRRARELVVEALRNAGLDPFVQPVPGCGGANVLAHVRGDVDRWVMLAAHFDHLGRHGKVYYPGADDNAAAVAVLVEVAQSLARRPPAGRGVLFAAFDGEEPPYFRTEAMGSQRWVRQPTVPLKKLDMMLCLELVGHAVGPAGLPPEVRNSLFLLGAERSEGTAETVLSLERSEPGLILRRADAEVIPPLSDYAPFWDAGVPWVLLTGARSRVYHTPQDTVELLDLGRVGRVARWCERFLRAQCARREGPVRLLRGGGEDRATLRSLQELLGHLEERSEEARHALPVVEDLLAHCDAEGRLPEVRRGMVRRIVELLEQGLA